MYNITLQVTDKALSCAIERLTDQCNDPARCPLEIFKCPFGSEKGCHSVEPADWLSKFTREK